MRWQYDDGGRALAGFRGHADDCVCRALAIATGKPYRQVYDWLNELAKRERRAKRSSARMGVHKPTIRRAFDELGWQWVATRWSRVARAAARLRRSLTW